MYSVFDLNWHPTVDGSFKDYQLNVPADSETHAKSNYFAIIGSNAVGLPNLGRYNDRQFYDLMSHNFNKKNFFWTLPYTGRFIEKNQKIYGSRHLICLKVHLRFLNKNIRDIDWKHLVLFCKRNGLALGLCTYYLNASDENDSLYEFKNLIDELLVEKVNLIFFHSFLDKFQDFYELYGHNKNILFDTSFSLKRCKKSTIDHYCDALNYGAQNICFGSDFPDYSLDDHRKVITYIQQNTTESGLENFLSQNAIKFLKAIIYEK